MDNILITGVCGFIGSVTARHLVKKYPEVNFIGLDKMSYCSNIKNLYDILGLKNFTFVKGDLCDDEFMKTLFNTNKIKIVLHFAAYSHVCHSFGNSVTFTRNNVIGTHILLEHSKEHKVKKFIHVSTDEVYGDSNDISSEKSILEPTNPYAASKAAAEHIVKSYYHSFKLPIIITRGNNVYGPYQFPEKVIPRFCLRLLSGQKCQIQGSGTQTRSFLHVDDVAEAFDIILNKGVIGETYNIGTSDQYSVLDVAQRLVKMIHNEGDWIYTVRDRDFNDQRYMIDSSKLHMLGWTPRISFDIGLKSTLEWYKQNTHHWSPSQLQNCLDCETQSLE